MTKEERLIQRQIIDNERKGKQLSDLSYKRDARFKALEVANHLKPSPIYGTQLNSNIGKQPEYDIVKKAEEIYKWLIKGLD
jgi:hypothetical protein